MLRTMQDGGSQSNGFAKAGAAAVGVSDTLARGNGTTTHWKSTYKGAVDETLTQPAQRASRPEWSLPRQAYSSKRSFFFTENMKSFGTYGENPLKKLHEAADPTKANLHELK